MTELGLKHKKIAVREADDVKFIPYPIVYTPFLVGFAFGLVLTVIAVASSLFRRQKLHGEARWARIGEVRRGKLLGSSGIVLGKFGGKVMRFGGPEHVLLEAPTRAGKGVGVIIPNLLDWPDSLVVLDIKQENYDNTAGYRLKVLGQRVVLFNPLDPRLFEQLVTVGMKTAA